MVSGSDRQQMSASLDLGPDLERGRSARFELAEHRRLGDALARLAPQRKGVVDAYVVALALDSDAVFGREAREAGPSSSPGATAAAARRCRWGRSIR